MNVIVNIKSLKSTRILKAEYLTRMCSEYNLYTRGSNSDYQHLMSKLSVNDEILTDELLLDLASDIYNHSDIEELMNKYDCDEDFILYLILQKIIAASLTYFNINSTYDKQC